MRTDEQITAFLKERTDDELDELEEYVYESRKHYYDLIKKEKECRNKIKGGDKQ